MKLLAVLVLLAGCDGTLGTPAPPATTHALVAGALTLVGRSHTACSSGMANAGGGGDVWCGFARAAGDKTELWVLDVSRAARETVRCDGSSAGCLRVASDVWTGTAPSAPFPTIDGFEGDTLFIYGAAPATNPLATYRGVISAWRPGWPTARPLTSPAGYTCHGHPTAAAAYCLDALVTEPHNSQFDLRAGALAGPGPGPLALVERIHQLGANGQIMWSAGFTPDGGAFLYSAPSADGTVEVLKVLQTSDGAVGAAAGQLAGAAGWQLAADGKKLYFLADYNYLENAPAGTLTMVDFPLSGAAGTALQDHVGSYAPLGSGGQDRGVALLRDVSMGDGTFRIIFDRSQPAQATTLASKVGAFLLSPDLRFTYLSQPESATGLVASTDGKQSCPFTSGVGIGPYAVAFAPDGNTIYWAEDDANAVDSDAWYTSSRDCGQKRRFSTRIAYLAPVRGGLVYADLDPGDLTMTLAHAPLEDGVLGDSAVIQGGIDVTAAQAGAQFVVYTITGGEAAGLYAYGPL